MQGFRTDELGMSEKQKIGSNDSAGLEEFFIGLADPEFARMKQILASANIPITEFIYEMAVTDQTVSDFSIGRVKIGPVFERVEDGGMHDAQC